MKRTIPKEAWDHLCRSVFRDGHLYPDLWHDENGVTVYEDCDNEELLHWLSFFTLDNWKEWSGATIICPRAPELEEVMVRFDELGKFKAHGYRNPYREPGVPDWYFFWTRNHTMGKMKRWARYQGLLPFKDLPLGQGGYGIDTGLRAHGYPKPHIEA